MMFVSEPRVDKQGGTRYPWYTVVDYKRHALVDLSGEQVSLAYEIGEKRQAVKQPWYRDAMRRDPCNPLDEGQKGSLCEVAFEALTGLPVDLSVLPGGDTGVDFFFPYQGRVVTIDVTGYCYPANLLMRADIVERGDLYVLSTWSSDRKNVLFLGWETREEMLKQPVKVFDPILGYKNHYMPQELTRPIPDLLRMIHQTERSSG